MRQSQRVQDHPWQKGGATELKLSSQARVEGSVRFVDLVTIVASVDDISVDAASHLNVGIRE